MPQAHSVPNSQTLYTKVGPKGISNANLISFSSNSMKPAQRNSLGRFLTSLDVAPFPALRQIEHSDCYWPITEQVLSPFFTPLSIELRFLQSRHIEKSVGALGRVPSGAKYPAGGSYRHPLAPPIEVCSELETLRSAGHIYTTFVVGLHSDSVQGCIIVSSSFVYVRRQSVPLSAEVYTVLGSPPPSPTKTVHNACMYFTLPRGAEEGTEVWATWAPFTALAFKFCIYLHPEVGYKKFNPEVR
jgi:hypothetical protein